MLFQEILNRVPFFLLQLQTSLLPLFGAVIVGAAAIVGGFLWYRSH